MHSERYKSVWDALCDTRAEAAEMELRSALMSAITERVESWDALQNGVAMRLGLTRPRLDDLMCGKIDKFSLDALVSIATVAGFKLRFQLDDATS